MAVETIPQLDQQLNQMTLESQWTLIPDAEESTHENGNYESAATSSQSSPAASVVGSSSSSFSSISGPEMSLPKSIVKKRRVGLDVDESYGQVTVEDNASEGAITDEETDDYAKFQEGEISFVDLGECDADDESSDKDSDEGGSDGVSVADSYEELNDEPGPNMSFITFTESVSFNMTVSYADAPVFDDSDSDSEDGPKDTMTLHEKMNRSFAPTLRGYDLIGEPEEHGHDDLDVDKRLLAAYVNGIRTANETYKTELAALALNINQGLSTTPFLSADFGDMDGLYLNHALKHVIGVFRNLVAADELEVLLDDAFCDKDTFKHCSGDKNSPAEPTTGKSSLHKDVSKLLSERLIDETMIVEEEVLDFFTRGVIYSLKKWAREDK